MNKSYFVLRTPHAEIVTPENFDECLDHCRDAVENFVHNHHKRIPSLSTEGLNAVAIYLGDSGLADNNPAVRRLITRLVFQALTEQPGGRYPFHTLKTGDSVIMPRSADARIRQALMRFRARQPMWNFTLRSIPINPYLMVLTRTA